jgi:hypothetical protein
MLALMDITIDAEDNIRDWLNTLARTHHAIYKTGHGNLDGTRIQLVALSNTLNYSCQPWM